MARAPRPLVEQGTYHVTARGNRAQTIYRDERDRVAFLGRLLRTASARRWDPLAWCLLGNHYHLLVRTPEADLDQGLRDVNGGYAQWFNRRHEVHGHLFQGRYGARLVVRESHLLATIRYIALNPVKAGIVTTAAAWPWSSHGFVLRGDSSALVAVASVLELFGGERRHAIDGYVGFIGDASGTEAAPLPLPAGLVSSDLRQLEATVGTSRAIAMAYDVLGMPMSHIARELGSSRPTISRRLREAEAEGGWA